MESSGFKAAEAALEKAINACLDAYASGRFRPLLEDDWLAMLYAQLFRELGDASTIHVKTRIGRFESKWDLVLGPVEHDYSIIPEAVAEVKFIARAFSDQQCLHVFDETRQRDLPKLASLRTTCGSVHILIFDEVGWFQRSRFRESGVSRLETIRQLAADQGIALEYNRLDEPIS